MRLVLIEWVDSFGCSSNWEELDDKCKPKILLCKSVGWLFKDEEDYKIIIPHIADTVKQGCGDMTIPTVCIKRICNLVEESN